jgi:hypothetical protein
MTVSAGIECTRGCRSLYGAWGMVVHTTVHCSRAAHPTGAVALVLLGLLLLLLLLLLCCSCRLQFMQGAGC